VEEARQELATIARRLEDAFPNENTDVTAGVSSLRDLLVGNVRPALVALFGAVGMVLLIVCANLANLLLVRGGARQSEIAVRASLGASRGRLLRQLLTESLVLGVGGALGGLLLAYWGVGALKAFAPPGFPRLDDIALDATALSFAAGLALATTVLFGFGPALQLARLPLADGLRQGRGEIGAAGRRRGRSLLLVAEVSLSLVLLAGAGLMTRSFAEIQAIRPGFDPDGVTSFTVSLPAARYSGPAAVLQAHAEIDARLAALPGVTSVGRIRGLPLGTGEDAFTFTRPDRPPPAPGRAPAVIYRVVDPEYFQTMRIPVRAGRAFTDRDGDGAPPVLVVSRRAAERFWPGEDPIGKTAAIQKGDGAARTIVGVVADVRSQALTSEPVPEFYVPHAQDPSPAVTYVVRSAQPAGGVLAAARQVVQGFDPKLPIVGAASMRQRVHDASARPRFSLALIGAFAALGLLLAAVGIYGVVAYAVGQRTREIGVRMALGARPAEVASLVLWQGMRPAIAGVGVGLLATLAGGRLVANLLYRVRPHDVTTLAVVVGLVLAIVVAACLVPARRATRIAPSTALRSE
jgi:putative ABC transport system permease protein